MAVVKSGKPAITHFRRVRRFHDFTHLHVSLESGRTHQIRVHMQHIGHPLVGDPTYGRSSKAAKGQKPELAEAVINFPRQALHARQLKLIHPATQKEVQFEAPRPADIDQLLKVLSKEAAWG